MKNRELKFDLDFPDPILIHHVFPLPTGKGFQDACSAFTVLAKVLIVTGKLYNHEEKNSTAA